MNKTINKFLLFAALMGGATGMASCDTIVINTDNPTPAPPPTPTPTPTPDPQPSPEELIAQAKQLLKDAQKDGAVVSATFTYNGKTYTATFKRENNAFVLQGELADGLDASLQEVVGVTADDPDNFIFTIVNKTTDETLLQVFIDTAEDTVEVKAADQKVAFSGVSVNGETVVMTPADPSSDSETVFVTGAALDQATLSLGIGRTATLTCTITPANATDKTVTWTSGDETVATVDASGKVTAVAEGKVTITAEPKGQNAHFKIASPSCEVKVSLNAMTVTAKGYSGTFDKEAHGITVSAPEGATIAYGEKEGTYDLKANPTYTNAGSYTVYYQVTMEGYTTVTGSAAVVINKAAGSISYATASVEKLVTDDAFTNALTITGDGTVTYSSSKESVATIDANGEVTIVGVGEATITATVADGTNYTYATKTATYTVKVLYVSDGSLTGMDDPEDI